MTTMLPASLNHHMFELSKQQSEDGIQETPLTTHSPPIHQQTRNKRSAAEWLNTSWYSYCWVSCSIKVHLKCTKTVMFKANQISFIAVVYDHTFQDKYTLHKHTEGKEIVVQYICFLRLFYVNAVCRWSEKQMMIYGNIYNICGQFCSSKRNSIGYTNDNISINPLKCDKCDKGYITLVAKYHEEILKPTRIIHVTCVPEHINGEDMSMSI